MVSGMMEGAWGGPINYFAVLIANAHTTEDNMITEFHNDTRAEVIRILQEYCANNSPVSGNRLRIFYGDAKTGRDWGEEHNVIGYVWNGTGTNGDHPILLSNRRSLGGGAILDHRIVRLIDVASKRELWRHPDYHQPEYTVSTDMDWAMGGTGPTMRECGYTHAVLADGQDTANFKSEIQARNWIAFMRGERMSK